MHAEILDLRRRFEVQPEMRQDGTSGPPERVTMTIRPCWAKPPVELELALFYESENVAYYHVVG